MKGWIVENSVESVNKSAVLRLFIAVESVNSQFFPPFTWFFLIQTVELPLRIAANELSIRP